MYKRRLNRKRFFTVLFILCATIALTVLVVSNSDILFITQENPTPSPSVSNTPENTPIQSMQPEPTNTEPPVTETPTPTKNVKEPNDNLIIRTDYEAFLPNESGDIPIVMFHNLIEAYEENTEKEYTTTFSEFEALLQTIYDAGFRLISMKDFIDCNISVPAGTMPMVFTFDDGTPGQFSLIEENGVLKANPRSAVGIMMDFNKKHPDFGLKGIFYVNTNVGDNTFEGAGTLKDRFEILQGLGLEIGNHTWGHVDYTEPKNNSAERIQESLGKNQAKAYEVMPNLKFYSLALPYGSIPSDKTLNKYLESGNYNGVDYVNNSIMAVGANPTPPSICTGYNPQYVPRVRAQGRVPVDADLTWWLPRMTSARMFISDGDPNTIVVPSDNEHKILQDKLNGKSLITY